MAQNIYNPSTGQRGYQVPGGALPSGWQWLSGGTSTPAPAPAPIPTPTATPVKTSTPTSTSSSYDLSKVKLDSGGMVITGSGSSVNPAYMSPSGYQQALAYATSGGTGTTAPAPASTTTTVKPAPAPTTTTPAPAPAIPTSDLPKIQQDTQKASEVQAPTSDLQPGMTGDEVKRLQDYLVSKGYMTQAQVNTGYGTYGPQTTAAVAALQKSLGVDNSTGVGFWGPLTMAALKGTPTGVSQETTPTGETVGSYKGTPITKGTDAEVADQMAKIDAGITKTVTSPASTGEPVVPETATGKTPTQNIIDTWSKVSEELGLSSIKEQYQKTLDEQKAMQNEKDDAAAEINNNPWYSEGKRQMELKKLDSRYETKLNTLSNYAKLYDALYQEGVSTAKFLAGEIQEDTQYAMQLAQKKQDAIDSLSKDNQVVSVNGREVLVNKSTGKIVANLGASKTTGTANTGTSYKSGGLVYSSADIGEGQQKLEESRGGDNWVDPSIYLQMYQEWVKNGGLLQDFLAKFPPKNYVNPANTWLPDYLMPTGARKAQEADEGIANPFK